MMRTIGRIAYWITALTLVAAILVSLDYKLAKAVLFALFFCPCALALEFLMPKAVKLMDKVYLSLAVLVSATLMILILHHYVWNLITMEDYQLNPKEVPPMLINPVFLGLVMTALSIGDHFWGVWLLKHLKPVSRTITFFSDRRSVTLDRASIAYIESNDTEVRIVTSDGESYRNKTGIGQWENLLGEGFLRVHRSYLVNVDLAAISSPDTVAIGDVRLPVSRKYKENVRSVLSLAKQGTELEL